MQRMNVKTASAAVVVGWAGVCAAQTITTEYGIEFCSVGAVGNAPVPRPPFSSGYANSPIVGKGRVEYEYRIGRTEITTGQWLEFVNTFNGTTYEDRPPFFDWAGPDTWGAVEDTTWGGEGYRYRLSVTPNAAMFPVFGISWRTAALYCNWLHNNKSSDPAALLSGAYDVSTWGQNANGTAADAVTHSPGARFWIPTIDEQIKAFYYDPNRNGPAQGGYWSYANGRDTPNVPGLPGVGETSAGLILDDQYTVRFIPLGSYPSQRSPWGLLDTSGGTAEWTEGWLPATGLAQERIVVGTAAGANMTSPMWSVISYSPSNQLGGFRLATSIPGPATVLVLLPFGICARRRRV